MNTERAAMTETAKGQMSSAVKGTTLKACSCRHDYQDALYGAGMRVHNVSWKKDGPQPSCTVCSPSRLTLRMRKAIADHDPAKHGGRK